MNLSIEIMKREVDSSAVTSGIAELWVRIGCGLKIVYRGIESSIDYDVY
jgi:hypothetical protein